MRILPILTLLGSLLGATTASASDIGIAVTGDASVRVRLSPVLDEWLRAHGHTPVDTKLSADVTTPLLACVERSDEPCARAVLDRGSSIPSLVVARADVRATKDGLADIELTAYWFRRGQETVAERRFCERCTDQLLRQSSDELLSALVVSDDIIPAHVTLTSTPAGATVLIDGTAVGVTPITYDIAAGRHQLTISAPDHEVDTREIVLRAGDTTRYDVPLATTGHSSESPHSSSRVAAVSLLAAGGVAVIAGGICIAVDEDVGPRSPRYIRDTAPLGVALVATGAASAAIGAYLWFRHRSSSSSAPVATIGGDGGYIGWAGRF